MMTALVLFTLWQPTPQDLAPLLSRSRLVVLDCICFLCGFLFVRNGDNFEKNYKQIAFDALGGATWSAVINLTSSFQGRGA